MTATLPPRMVPAARPAAAHDDRRLQDALAAAQELARRVVPGCDYASVDLLEADGSSTAVEPASDPNPCDIVSVPLLSGPMNEGGQLLGVLHLFSHSQPFGPGAAEPAALVARVTAAIVAGRSHDRMG